MFIQCVFLLFHIDQSSLHFSDTPIKLSQKFESIFFELLMKKWDRNVLEIIIPDIADCRTMNPDK